ncbi:hypothetical protein MPSEU_001039900 [Mayamaea pseudoterrestris]|nr:hypothetical protein MPSEU_001039900 [Mayamaea pseudoterrestris]
MMISSSNERSDDSLSVEDVDSWNGHQRRRQLRQDRSKDHDKHHRQLKHHRHHQKHDNSAKNAWKLENKLEKKYQHENLRLQRLAESQALKSKKSHSKLLKQLWSDPGIDRATVHGLMIDAGSTGSRMHVYEWEPRLLETDEDVSNAVSGSKLSFPGTDSRWTDRLEPGLASFASIGNGLELQTAIAEYLQPLLEFAKTILHEKEEHFGDFPIFLRATAGMRILSQNDRTRVLNAVRRLFHNESYCPFAFTNEQARTLSGEEEAIFDWTGVNFVLGDLLEQSQGAGTVVNPKQTVGALDLGGASTQISFFEPEEDIMANLFKLQIGQAKHWNVYSHSYLYYGMNEAIHRYQARLVADKSSDERLIEGVHDPCLPGGATSQVRSNIHVTPTGMESWNYTQVYPSGNGYYQAMLKNKFVKGDFERCMRLTKDLLHLEKNDWCEFAHQGDCSFAGIYQPKLPTQSETVGSFVGFSNYYHVWKFLDLPEYATLHQLHDATKRACEMSRDELLEFTDGRIQYENIESYCFRSAYAFQLLHSGYGFGMNDTIRATKVINGHKISWALGAMLYEINTMPWRHAPRPMTSLSGADEVAWDQICFVCISLCCLALALYTILRRRSDRLAKRQLYESLAGVDGERVHSK